MEKDSELLGWLQLALWTAGIALLLGLLALAGYCAVATSDVGACARGISFQVMSALLHLAGIGYGYAGAKMASRVTGRTWVVCIGFFGGMAAWQYALIALGFPLPLDE
jgi:hypothetical protein